MNGAMQQPPKTSEAPRWARTIAGMCLPIVMACSLATSHNGHSYIQDLMLDEGDTALAEVVLVNRNVGVPSRGPWEYTLAVGSSSVNGKAYILHPGTPNDERASDPRAMVRYLKADPRVHRIEPFDTIAGIRVSNSVFLFVGLALSAMLLAWTISGWEHLRAIARGAPTRTWDMLILVTNAAFLLGLFGLPFSGWGVLHGVWGTSPIFENHLWLFANLLAVSFFCIVGTIITGPRWECQRARLLPENGFKVRREFPGDGGAES